MYKLNLIIFRKHSEEELPFTFHVYEGNCFLFKYVNFPGIRPEES